MDLSTWWETISLLQKIYWVVASTSTIVFIILLVLMFIGGDADDVDLDHDGDFQGVHADGMDIFSLKSILAFLMFFGWSGLAAIEMGMIVWWASLGISFVVGLIMMFVTAWVIMLLYNLQQDGTMNFNSAIGKTGEVYLTIPAKMTGAGKIQIIINSSYKTLDAMTNDEEEIKTLAHVQVIDVEGETLIVTKIK